MAAHAAAGMGHNNPPNPLDRYLDDLSEVAQPVLKRLNELVERQQQRVPAKFETSEQALKGISLAMAIGDLLDTIEVLVKQNRKPLDDMTALMRTNGQAWCMAGEQLRTDVRAKVDAFMDTMPAGQQLRTEYGDLAIRKHVLKAEITDKAAVPADYREPSMALIQATIKAKVTEAKARNDNAAEAIDGVIAELSNSIPGVRFYRENQLVLTPTGKT